MALSPWSSISDDRAVAPNYRTEEALLHGGESTDLSRSLKRLFGTEILSETAASLPAETELRVESFKKSKSNLDTSNLKNPNTGAGILNLISPTSVTVFRSSMSFITPLLKRVDSLLHCKNVDVFKEKALDKKTRALGMKPRPTK